MLQIQIANQVFTAGKTRHGTTPFPPTEDWRFTFEAPCTFEDWGQITDAPCVFSDWGQVTDPVC